MKTKTRNQMTSRKSKRSDIYVIRVPEKNLKV